MTILRVCFVFFGFLISCWLYVSNVQALTEVGTWSPNALVALATQQSVNRVLSAWSGLVEITGDATIKLSHKMHAVASFFRSRGLLRVSNVMVWLANKLVTHDVRLVVVYVIEDARLYMKFVVVQIQQCYCVRKCQCMLCFQVCCYPWRYTT